MAKRDRISDRLSQLKDMKSNGVNQSQQDLLHTKGVIELGNDSHVKKISSDNADKESDVYNSFPSVEQIIEDKKEQERETIKNRLQSLVFPNESPLKKNADASFEKADESKTTVDDFYVDIAESVIIPEKNEQPKATNDIADNNPFIVVSTQQPVVSSQPTKDTKPAVIEKSREQRLIENEQKLLEKEKLKQLQLQTKAEKEKKRQLEKSYKAEQKQIQEEEKQKLRQIQEQKKSEQLQIQKQKNLEHIEQLEKKREENILLKQAQADKKALLAEEKRILKEQRAVAQMKIDEQKRKEREAKKAERVRYRQEHPLSEKVKKIFKCIGKGISKAGKNFVSFIKDFKIFKTGSAPYRFIESVKKKIRAFFKAIGRFFRFVFKPKNLLFIFPSFLIILIAVNRLPSFIYNKFFKEEPLSVYATVDKDFASAVSETLADYPNEDFDGDEIYNGLDDHPFDKDYDRNGIIDSDTSSTFKTGVSMKIEDVTFIPESSECGVTEMLGLYVVNGYKDNWLKIDNYSGFVPYVYYDEKWHPAKYEEKTGSILVYIPSNYCYVKMLSEKSEYLSTLYLFNWKFSFDYTTPAGKLLDGILTVFFPYRSDYPYDIGCRERTITYFEENFSDVMASTTVTKVNKSNLSRFTQMPLDNTDLRSIYLSIDAQNTRILSVQSDEGESLLIVYGYDRMGNFYVADYNDTSKKGKLEIKPYAHLISDNNGTYSVFYTVDVKGMSIDSKNSKVVLIK